MLNMSHVWLRVLCEKFSRSASCKCSRFVMWRCGVISIESGEHFFFFFTKKQTTMREIFFIFFDECCFYDIVLWCCCGCLASSCSMEITASIQIFLIINVVCSSCSLRRMTIICSNINTNKEEGNKTSIYLRGLVEHYCSIISGMYN